jgi:flagellar biosynthesis protein FlhG
MIGQADRVIELSRLKTDFVKTSDQKIFVFTSGKGGTGKTFVSLNLACTLSKKYKVLFVDLDPNLSNANIMMNIIPTKTIFNYISGRELLQDTITEYGSNLHFIFGDSGKLNYPWLKNDSIRFFFNHLRNIQSEYDFIIIDTGSGAGSDVFSIILQADVNIIITNPEPTAVMDAYVMLKLLNNHDYKGEKLILLNKCLNEDDSESAFKNLTLATEHFLNQKLNFLGTIYFDKSVMQAIIAQSPISMYDPQSPVNMQIQKIANRLYEYVHMANIHHS